MNYRFPQNNVNSLLLTVLITFIATHLDCQVIEKGKIIDPVKSLSRQEQSYSLYLPLEYDDNRKWPVILIFDPSARGKTGVEVFRNAGQRYGYILACSNNSRNGPFGNNLDASSIMLADLEKRFNIDRRRIYASGFSGGSRFAMALAVTNKIVAGVIGCGAGLPNDRNLYPGMQSTFDYYGLAGNRDMNYTEMYELKQFLDKNTSVTSSMRIFNGGHDWPDPVLLEDAVGWLTLRAIRRSLIPDENKFLTDIETRTRSQIQTAASEGNFTDAALYMKIALRDFSGSPFGDDLKRSLSTLENSKEYREATREWNRMVLNEKNRKEKYLSNLSTAVYMSSLPDTVSEWWKEETESLKRLRDHGKPADSQMSSRLLNFISILCFEQGNAAYRQKNYEQASVWFEICTLSDSENSNTWYSLSRSFAALNRSRDSFEALDKAIQKGLNNRKAVESDPVFNNIRNDSRFKALLMKMN